MDPQPPASPPPTPSPVTGPIASGASKARETAVYMIIAAAVLIILGSFLPWGKVEVPGFSVSVSGTEGGDGWFAIFLAAAAAGLAFKAKGSATGGSTGPLVFSIIVSLLTAYEFIDISGAADEVGGGASVTIGIGLYIMAVGCLAAIVGSIRLKTAS